MTIIRETREFIQSKEKETRRIILYPGRHAEIQYEKRKRQDALFYRPTCRNTV
jgi:hypothetical protein